MDACTEDFNCLVINNNAKSNKIEDQVFWYKADPHSEFKIGASEFWKHHNNNYNNGYDTDEDDSNFAPPRKKGPIVDVIKTNY